MFASFASEVSEPVRAGLRDAEVVGLRDDPDAGLTRLAALLETLPADNDDDRVAIAEMTGLLRLWGGTLALSDSIFESCRRQVRAPRARGAVLLARARSVPTADSTAMATEALSEFSAAGDIRGRAVTLTRLAVVAGPTTSVQHRLRLGREGIELARELGDPWTIAMCTGHLAILEVYTGQPNAMDLWARSVSFPAGGVDSLASEVISLNYTNWAFTALGYGDYELAMSVIGEGRTTAHGSSWASRYTALEGLVHLRKGELAEAARLAARAEHAGPDRMVDYHVAIRAAVALERERHLESGPLSEAMPRIEAFSMQVGSTAAGVLALTRHSRREPNPTREVLDILHKSRASVHRFGWEDALLALAMARPAQAKEEAALLADLWPPNPRGLAMRAFIEGLLAGRKGFDKLVSAAEALERLPEPVTAGKAYHAAAAVAPTADTGNKLRWRAVELFQHCGADRSLAAVARDRRLHRGDQHVQVPDSQRRAVNAGLTPKEREIAILAAKGMTALEIADQLGISVGTARNYLVRVREKFGGIPKRQLAQVLGMDQVE